MVLDFKNQTYVLDKSLPLTLPEGFLLGECLTFKKFTQWHKNNRKVDNVVLGSMSNEIQKQYGRYTDVWSIMHRMKELCAAPEWHMIFRDEGMFGMIMIKGSSVREHGVMMHSLVEKLKDLQTDFKEEEIYNMNRLQESLHELINILVKYEAMIEKFAPTVQWERLQPLKRRARLPDARRGRMVRCLLLLLALRVLLLHR
ncbi:UNVERIFIED_CONTAM: hypothetical protein Sradi_4124600 [Sesamum radiatum]|uniref:Uncharacterized protein n=1 Tax=Sesamum radiatum TaxID=300843 RepID=A0AAW2P1Q6_SESRA